MISPGSTPRSKPSSAVFTQWQRTASDKRKRTPREEVFPCNRGDQRASVEGATAKLQGRLSLGLFSPGEASQIDQPGADAGAFSLCPGVIPDDCTSPLSEEPKGLQTANVNKASPKGGGQKRRRGRCLPENAPF